MDHKKLCVYRSAKDRVPTFFPVFSDARIQSSDVNAFEADQFKKIDENPLKTVINTGTSDAAVVPSTFLNRGLFIHKDRLKAYTAAWETARYIHSLFKKDKLTKGMSNIILKEYTRTHGLHFHPYYTESISSSYPIVTIKYGWMVAKTIAGYPQPFETEIKVVARGFRDYAEIGVDFIERHHCCFCLLSPKWAKNLKDPYHFFVDASHQDCPFVKK